VVLFAATGSCGAFTDVFCSDPETNITAPITPGTTYYFMVAMFSATAQPTVPYALTYTYTPATGQCCVGSSCTITTHSNCNTMSGTYGGDNISCNPPAGMPTNFGPGPSYTIVDNATGTSEITVGGTPFPLGAVSVSVDLTHTFQSDVILTLTNGSTTVSLHKGDGALVNNLGGTYVFTDTATQTLDSAAAGLLTADVLAPGNYKAADTGNVAVSLNDAFYNQTSVGTWTLSIGDDASLDTGAMSAWTLILDGQGASPCSAPCPGNHDGNGQVDADDLFAFLDDWFAQNGVCMSGCTANYIAPDAVDADDLFAYLDIWFANNGNICP
jgi:subtilisin-like proprotein convertase family protein